MATIAWRTIPHAAFYEVSENGAVRLRVNLGNRRAGLILRGTKIRGYQWYLLHVNDGVRRMNSAHALVLQAFVGPRPSMRHHAAHNDGDKSNNHLSNLRWATPEENLADAVRHGAWKGSRHAKAILTEADVVRCRYLYEWEGARVTPLAREYGVHPNTMTAAIRGRSWKHV